MSSTDIQKILNDEEAFQNAVDLYFKSADTDGSGQINLNELHSLVNSLLDDWGVPDDKKPPREDTENLLNFLDKDQSGKLNKKEFSVLVRKILETML